MTDSESSTCKSRLQITPRGQITVTLLHLAAGAAWLSGDPNVRLAASLLAAPVVLDIVWKLVARPRLAIAMRARRGISRRPFHESLELRNLSPRAALREFHLREPRTAPPEVGGAHVPWLPSGNATTVHYTARHPRRGLQTARSFEGETSWPLGLFRWRVELVVPATLLSEPARVAIDPTLARASEDERASRPARKGEAREFWALREYRNGEDARHAHARRSAALGTLVLSVWRGHDVSERALVLDLRRSPGLPDISASRRLERQLGRAAWLVDHWSAEGVRFTVHAIERGLHTWTVDGSQQARDVTAWFAIAGIVPYRALDDDEKQALEALPQSVWIAAGGYRDRLAGRRGHALQPGEAKA